jgi:hypothetical protein
MRNFMVWMVRQKTKSSIKFVVRADDIISARQLALNFLPDWTVLTVESIMEKRVNNES